MPKDELYDDFVESDEPETPAIVVSEAPAPYRVLGVGAKGCAFHPRDTNPDHVCEESA